MTRLRDLTGQTFERWTVIERGEDYVLPGGSRKVQWRCRCRCGTVRLVSGQHLLSGRSQSCGCLARELAAAPRKQEVVYSQAHKRIRRALGKAAAHPCADGCGHQAKDWSYQGGCPDELIEPNGDVQRIYCLHQEHYRPRCGPCHHRHDHELRTHCKHGHLLDEDNLVPSTLAKGWRVCRQCMLDVSRERNAVVRAARQALGVTEREYRPLFGQSGVMAECVLWAAEACAAAAEGGR